MMKQRIQVQFGPLPNAEKLTPFEKQILEAVRESLSLSLRSLSNAVGCPFSVVHRKVKRLCDYGFLEVVTIY